MFTLWVSGDEASREQERNDGYLRIRPKMYKLVEEQGYKKDNIVIKADLKAYHEKIIKLIDIAKYNNIKGFSLVPPFK